MRAIGQVCYFMSEGERAGGIILEERAARYLFRRRAERSLGAVPFEDETPGAERLRGFQPSQLVACERCARANAPTRMNCLYCGAPLPQTEESEGLRRPALRKLEEWEQGHNVVLLPRGERAVAPEALAESASLLKLEVAHLEQCLAGRRGLPVARAATAEEATLILKRLRVRGLQARVYSDEELATEAPPRNVRALELGAEALLLWAGREESPERLPWSQVALLARGRVTRKRLEVEERGGRFRRGGEMVDARELSTDEAVLDIYARGGGEGWRLWADHLDYSCLGARKGLTARENFGTLLAALRESAAGAEFDEEYAALRPLLTPVWPPSERDESQGVRREGTGRYNTGKVTTVSNEAQFTRYTRLLSRLAGEGPSPEAE
jgi:hypothetical protein